MTYDPHGQYGSDPRYPQYPQQDQYPPQYPPQDQHPPQYPPNPGYGQSPQSPSGGNDPTAPIVPSYGGSDPYGGSTNPYGGSGQYGGGAYGGGGGQYGGGQYGGTAYGSGDPYSGSQYGSDPYGGVAPSSGWPPPPGSVPPGGAPPRKSRTGLTIGLVAGGVVLVLCLVGAAVAGTRLLADDPDPTDPTIATDPNNPDNPENPDAGGDPFAGTPAESFADGADGIQLPEAQAVGDFSAEQVEETLGLVEEALVATRLDERMLVQRDPETFISMMSPDNQEGLRKEFTDGTFGYFASQIAEDAELAVPTPRVEGSITFEATTDNSGFRVIEVVTNFVWAYAFEVPNDNSELDGIVVVRDQLVWQTAHEDDVADSSLGLWLWEGEAYASGINCDAFDQGLLAPQTELQAGVGGPDESDVYDPEGSLDLPDNC